MPPEVPDDSPDPSPRVPIAGSYLLYAASFGLVFALAKIILLFLICIESYGLAGLNQVRWTNTPWTVASDLLLGALVATIVLVSQRFARLIADACLIYYLINIHYAAIYGDFINARVLIFARELSEMRTSVWAEVTLLV